jgi:hypothetical protein
MSRCTCKKNEVVSVNNNERTYNFYLNNFCLFDEGFKYYDGTTF